MAKSAMPTRGLFRGWSLVIVVGLLLAVVALIDRGGLDATTPAAAVCQVRVTVAELNVRTGPSQQAASVRTLAQGSTLDATNVLTAGFRQLVDRDWVFDQYVTPIAGSTCT